MSSTVIAKNLQVGADGTASNNFTIYQPASPDGTLRIGNGNTGTTSAQVVLTSAGNVGIGTSSPSARLHVVSTSADAAIVASNQVSTFQYFVSSGTSQGPFIGGTGNDLLFGTTGSARMRIDSTGNVGIGTSSPGLRLDVAGSMRSLGGTGESQIFLQTNTTSVYFYNNNTNNQIGLYDGSSGQARFSYTKGTNRWDFYNGGAESLSINSAGTVILPKGQIQFPATQNPSTNANTLDDYEEGTWTPVVYNTSFTVLTPGVDYSVDSTAYRKIGGFVSCVVRIQDLRATKAALYFSMPFTATIGDFSAGVFIGGNATAPGEIFIFSGGTLAAYRFNSEQQFKFGTFSFTAN